MRQKRDLARVKSLWKWSRLCSLKHEDAWEERLRFLGPQLACFRSADSRILRFETYLDSESAAAALKKRFGGTITKVKNRDLLASVTPQKPQKIRDRLIIDPSPESNPAIPAEKRLHIPAGMAFGTGEHATTATCLRLLCDIERDLAHGWEIIDLGTGSGILGLAACRLGARKAWAFDNDAACIRIARENARLNGIRNFSAKKADVLQWQAENPVEVVTSNLYSEILIKAAAQIASAIAPGGFLIFSGVLKSQYSDCAEAFRRKGLEVEAPRIKGKWTAGLARRK